MRPERKERLSIITDRYEGIAPLTLHRCTWPIKSSDIDSNFFQPLNNLGDNLIKFDVVLNQHAATC